MILSAEQTRKRALALGFDRVGIVRAAPSPTLSAYLRWIDKGMHGEMRYMARPDRQARRRDLNLIVPSAQSLLVVALDYGAQVPAALLEDPRRGRIAAYAWGSDYHDIMSERLERLAAWLAECGSVTGRVYVDTGAILERSHGWMAGLGFIGKNTMLIHPRRGGTFFIGEIVLTAVFDHYDSPLRPSMCGTCARCLSACPTDAFPQPYVLDARRCISYLTIELRGAIDRTLRPAMGNWVFGCDLCQDVCPFQRFAPGATEPALLPVDVDRAAPPLVDLLGLDQTRFKARFQGTPLYRTGRDRLVRNACIAAGNARDPSLRPALIDCLDDESSLVRGHAAWALGRIGGASDVLAARLLIENDNDVRAEIAAAIG
ncbi:MAG: tRNA epoxyqueuosine(34) reductase QueG [Aggregatilineales bacterium]